MSCCAPGAEGALALGNSAPSAEELLLASREVGEGLRQSDLSVPGVYCAACIQAVESALLGLEGVEHARVNLSSRRVAIRWREGNVPPLVEALARIGYEAHLFDFEAAREDRTLKELIRALAVSGFAAGNIMLLSVSVWSGAEAATRDLFHWVSALIAIPALFFAGGIYFRSAWGALRHGRMNMDVPIAIGVSMAYALSLYDTMHSGRHAYFDASVTLLFFLLIGRTLDHVMRDRARAAVAGLARLSARGASVLRGDGGVDYLPVEEIRPGMKLIVAAGERLAVDGRVLGGTSELDCALVTGESAPQRIAPGGQVRAGTLNLTGPITMEATAAVQDSFLAEMIRLMEAAEGGRARYRRIAERVSTLYAPVVHLTAFVTMIGWIFVSGDLHRSITIAIAVLIITCPCALGLAVPIVQVMAARRLFESGIMVKDGSAMERLAEIDAVVFDKTGTLTLGRARLTNAAGLDPLLLSRAAGMAAHSRHPRSLAIAAAAGEMEEIASDAVREIPGCGLEARIGGRTWRLGRPGWALAARDQADGHGTVLSRDGEMAAAFDFEDALRPRAAACVAELAGAGLDVEIVSGDTREAVGQIARALSVPDWQAGILPAGKTERLHALARAGRKVLMVGDGLNDAPALAAAHVAMAPATAADIGRNAADFVFLREGLEAVPLALDIALKSQRLIRQNIALAIAYNAIAVPIAILGYVTPLVAAVAMSLSSILVIGNALRLRARADAGAPRQEPQDRLSPPPLRPAVAA